MKLHLTKTLDKCHGTADVDVGNGSRPVNIMSIASVDLTFLKKVSFLHLEKLMFTLRVNNQFEKCKLNKSEVVG